MLPALTHNLSDQCSWSLRTLHLPASLVRNFTFGGAPSGTSLLVGPRVEGGGASRVGLVVKNQRQETQVPSLGQEDPPGGGRGNPLVFLPGESQGQDPGGLQSMGSQSRTRLK